MDIVFLNSLFPDNLISEIESNSKGSIQYAANALQWNFVHGIRANIEEPFTIITAPIIGSFPLFYKKLFIQADQFTYDSKSKGISLGYWNIPILKNYIIKKVLFRELNSWATQRTDKVKIVVVYGMLAPWMLASIELKKKYGNIHICLIVPDLPEYMNNSKGLIFKLRGLIKPNLYLQIPKIDSFVFLTDEMAKHFDITNKPWVTIEGMINPEEINYLKSFEQYEKKIVMYSGTLAERYGILDLMAAFDEIKESDYELWICGSGNTEDIIKSKSMSDRRIRFFGLLPREQVLALQNKATVLVNPRSSEGEYTKYSFPSKIMEYLLSGTPCIMKPLPGIPKEYAKYIFMVGEDDITSLKNKILEVCNLDNDTLRNIGEVGQKFVLNNKNYKVQTKKMIDMLKASTLLNFIV